MTTTKRDATATAPSSPPPPDLHEYTFIMPAGHGQLASMTNTDNHDEAPDVAEPHDTLPTRSKTALNLGSHADFPKNDELTEIEDSRPQVPRPPFSLPDYLVAQLEALAQRQSAQREMEMRQFAQLVQTILPSGLGHSNAQAVPLTTTPDSVMVPDHSVQPPPVAASEQLKELSSFEALLRAGPNPLPKVGQADVPADKSGDSKQPFQTGGCVSSNDDNNSKNGTDAPMNAAGNEETSISPGRPTSAPSVSESSSSILTPPTPVSELLKDHSDFQAYLKNDPHTASRAKQMEHLDKSWKIAEALGVTPEAFKAALSKVTAEIEGKAKVKPMTTAQKEKVFWKIAAMAGLMCLGAIVLLLFFILGWDIGWIREVNGSLERVFVFWVAFLSFPIVVLVSAGVLVEAETRLIEDRTSVET
jgi:hypothetical protein